MKPSWFFLFLCLDFSANAQCVGTTPKNATTFSNNTSIGSLNWVNNGNAQTSDNTYATAGQFVGVFSTITSEYLVASNFGFSIPIGSAICGILVEVEKNASGLGIGASIKDNSVKLIKGGSLVAAEYANNTSWGSSDSYTSYGGSTDTWGTSWTPSDINSNSFGIAISIKMSTGIAGLFLTASIDHMRVTVFFATPVPIRLLSFTGKQESGKVKLDWVTATEINSKAFVPQRLNNTNAWVLIDSIDAAGNSSSDRYYSCLDSNPGSVNYYRLKQVDWDGSVQYSKMIRVEFIDPVPTLITLFPNPALNYLNIKSSIPIDQLNFFNAQLVELFPPVISQQGNTRTYDLTHQYPGVYFVRIYSQGSRYSFLLSHPL